MVERNAGAPTDEASDGHLPFELPTPHGTVRGDLPLPPQAVRLSEVVVPLLTLDSALVDQAVRHAAAGHTPCTCGPGCGTCCRQLVPLSAPEAFALTATMRHLSGEQRQRLRPRFTAIGATLARYPDLARRIFTVETSDAAVNATALAYFDLGLPCPFLEAESCAIHRFRPAACREFNVASDPAWCATPAAATTVAIPAPLRLSSLLAQAHAHLYRLPQPLLVPLSLAPSWCADHPELDRLAWDPATLMRDLLGAMARVMKISEGSPPPSPPPDGRGEAAQGSESEG